MWTNEEKRTEQLNAGYDSQRINEQIKRRTLEYATWKKTDHWGRIKISQSWERKTRTNWIRKSWTKGWTWAKRARATFPATTRTAKGRDGKTARPWARKKTGCSWIRKKTALRAAKTRGRAWRAIQNTTRAKANCSRTRKKVREIRVWTNWIIEENCNRIKIGLGRTTKKNRPGIINPCLKTRPGTRTAEAPCPRIKNCSRAATCTRTKTSSGKRALEACLRTTKTWIWVETC